MDNDDINYQNNPLHGVGLKSLLVELVDHYGFEILFAYLNINCFKTNASIDSSIKFLKNTDWAREKVEVFYLYEFKNLPRASSEQFLLSPRDRIIPEHHLPCEPTELSFEDADRLREKRSKKSAAMGHSSGHSSGHSAGRSSGYSSGRSSGHSSDKGRGAYKNRDDKQRQNEDGQSSSSVSPPSGDKVDPWANARNKLKK